MPTSESPTTTELRIVVTAEPPEPELLGSYIGHDAEGVGVFYTRDGADVLWAADDVCQVVTVLFRDGQVVASMPLGGRAWA